MAWMKIGHRTDLSEAWSLTSSGQYRTGTSNDLWLTELEFTKSVNKKWDIGTGDKIAGRKLSFGYFYQRDLTNTGMHSHFVQTSVRF
jgi:hypothetical protein